MATPPRPVAFSIPINTEPFIAKTCFLSSSLPTTSCTLSKCPDAEAEALVNLRPKGAVSDDCNSNLVPRAGLKEAVTLSPPVNSRYDLKCGPWVMCILVTGGDSIPKMAGPWVVVLSSLMFPPTSARAECTFPFWNLN